MTTLASNMSNHTYPAGIAFRLGAMKRIFDFRNLDVLAHMKLFYASFLLKELFTLPTMRSGLNFFPLHSGFMPRATKNLFFPHSAIIFTISLPLWKKSGGSEL